VNAPRTGRRSLAFLPSMVRRPPRASLVPYTTLSRSAGANAWTALGHGTDSLGNPAPATNESQSGSVNGVSAATTLTLKSAPTSVEAGSLVTIEIGGATCREGTLTNVNVTGTGRCAGGFTQGRGTLLAVASQDFTCTFTAGAGANAWTALGHGTDSLGNPAPATNESQSGSVNGVSAATTLTLKSAPTSVEAGSLVTIVVTETNTGNGTLTNRSEERSGGSAGGFTRASDTLEAGASQDFTCTFTAAAGANAWTALGHGTDSLGNPAPATNESQSGSVNGVSAATTLTLKSAPTSVEAGSLVTIVVTETNTGNGTLTNVNVTGTGGCAGGFTPASVTLVAGASQDFPCTFPAPACADAWTALGHGTDSLGNPAPATNESQSGSVNGVSAATTLTLKSAPTSVEAGSLVTIVVT